MDENNVGIHKISLCDRNNINISGVVKVVNSNSNGIILKLKETELHLQGSNLTIENFSDGQIFITGILDSLKYSKVSKEKEGFFKRIFK